MGNYPTPRISPTERVLIERSKRMSQPLPPLLIWATANTAAQLPHELTTRLIHKRKFAPVGDFGIKPSIVLHEDQIDEELEASLIGVANA
jgi:hypothetical protein